MDKTNEKVVCDVCDCEYNCGNCCCSKSSIKITKPTKNCTCCDSFSKKQH